MENRGITVKNINESIDLGDLLKTVIKTLDKEEDKRLLYLLILSITQSDVEWLNCLSQPFQEMAKSIPSFFLKRVEDYRKAFKWNKIFGFASSGKIEKKSVEEAFQDVKKMITEISFPNNDVVRGIANCRKELVVRLATNLIQLLNQEGKYEIAHLDLEALAKKLEGR